jgi:hypothetical protein
MKKRWSNYEIAEYKGHSAKHIIAQNIVRSRFENLSPEATACTFCPLGHNTVQLGGKITRFRWGFPASIFG